MSTKQLSSGDQQQAEQIWLQNSFAKMKDVPFEWIIDGFIPKNEKSLITGSFGGMKTFLSLFMANAIADGADFAGRKCQQHNVLILDRQNSLATLNMRGKAIAKLRNRQNVTVIGLHSEPSSLDIGQERLKAICQIYKPVIFIDSLIDYIPDGKSESDSVTMNGILREFHAWIDCGASAVVVLHHKTKTGNNYRGTTAIPAAVSTAINISNRKGSGSMRLLTLKHFKARDGEEDEIQLKVTFENRDGQLVKATCGTDGVRAAKAGAKSIDDLDGSVLAYLKQNPGQSKNSIAKGVGGKKTNVLQCVDRLKQDMKAYVRDGNWFPTNEAATQ